jgi:oligoendopeptidase F
MTMSMTHLAIQIILTLLLITMAPEAVNSDVDLPRWDLNRFGFESPFSEEIDKHLEETKSLSKAFKESYEGKLASKSLLDAVTEFERISVRRALVSSYLSLSYDVALEDDALKKRKGAISQVQSEITGDYLEWFELDVAEMSQGDVDKHYVEEADLINYKAFLDELRRQRPHNLDK